MYIRRTYIYNISIIFRLVAVRFFWKEEILCNTLLRGDFNRGVTVKFLSPTLETTYR